MRHHITPCRLAAAAKWWANRQGWEAGHIGRRFVTKHLEGQAAGSWLAYCKVAGVNYAEGGSLAAVDIVQAAPQRVGMASRTVCRKGRRGSGSARCFG